MDKEEMNQELLLGIIRNIKERSNVHITYDLYGVKSLNEKDKKMMLKLKDSIDINTSKIPEDVCKHFNIKTISEAKEIDENDGFTFDLPVVRERYKVGNITPIRIDLKVKDIPKEAEIIRFIIYCS